MAGKSLCISVISHILKRRWYNFFVGSICTFNLGQWQCPLESEAERSFCCLHDGKIHQESIIIDQIQQLSHTKNKQLLSYQLRDFESPKKPALQFKDTAFHRGLWSSIKWHNDFFIRCDFINLEFENVSMEACVLEEFKFKNSIFYGHTDVRSNWLRGAFENVHSKAQNFQLEGTKIKNCLFSACSWESLSLYNCVLSEVYFADCSFKQASFVHCDFVNCKFEGNSGILAMENCELVDCKFNEPEDQFFLSKVNCQTKS